MMYVINAYIFVFDCIYNAINSLLGCLMLILVIKQTVKCKTFTAN